MLSPSLSTRGVRSLSRGFDLMRLTKMASLERLCRLGESRARLAAFTMILCLTEVKDRSSDRIFVKFLNLRDQKLF